MRKLQEFFRPIKLVDTKVLVDTSQMLFLNFCMESFIFTWGDLQLQKNFHTDFFYWYWIEQGVNYSQDFLRMPKESIAC